ncbi:SDR family NAD(P)-dependent oxidoreductase [Hoeflea sp. WL0058]|uniref:SDR family NAD(P)-dependent oxidoreductase n=1 Tax=Flavimaribacter sediminis TaxID=2865987 RepID=A0AAE3D0X0_9HYPH|nr:SDR family NAD(P)-dependent oxidoreductase [Flavimaribacter sediminis]MBW8637372.1 SDR family NAD(P)-dependent oxidoreductase [Flavimaribacter sediminis]
MAGPQFDPGNVWVIGASSGIGRAFSEKVAGMAQNIAVSARSTDPLFEMEKQGRGIVAFPLDVTNAEAVENAAKDIASRFGAIDTVVLSAGAWKPLEPGDIDIASIRRGVEVNYMGAIHAIAALVPIMKRQGKGHIVIVGSLSGYRGLPRTVNYGPTKAALISLAETLKLDLKRFNIRITLVNPGFVDTKLTQKNDFKMPQLISAEQAADYIISGIQKERFEIRFPHPFATVFGLLRCLPNALYFRAVGRMIKDRA